MRIDNSGLSGFSRCHIYGALASWLHRRPNRESLPAQLGRSAHVISRHYLGGQIDLLPIIQTETEKIKQLALDNDLPDKWRDEALTKFHSIISNMLQSYPIQMTNNGVVVRTPSNKTYHVRYTEIGFTLPVANGRHTLIGSIDAIVEDAYNHWRVFELKTSRHSASNMWKNQWLLSTQPLTYEYVAQTTTKARVLGTLIVPFNTNTLDCRADPIIEVEHTPRQLDQWMSDIITYLDWLQCIADECGITFDKDGASILPPFWTDTEKCAHISALLPKLIPTGRFCGNCSNAAFGQCQYYDICSTTYNPTYIAARTHHSVWNPLTS